MSIEKLTNERYIKSKEKRNKQTNRLVKRYRRIKNCSVVWDLLWWPIFLIKLLYIKHFLHNVQCVFER